MGSPFHPTLLEGGTNPAYRVWTCDHEKGTWWDYRVRMMNLGGWCWTCEPVPDCAPFFGDAGLVQVWRDYEALRAELWAPLGEDESKAAQYHFFANDQGRTLMAISPERLRELVAAPPLNVEGRAQQALLSLAVLGGQHFVDAFVVLGTLKLFLDDFQERIGVVKDYAAQLEHAVARGQKVRRPLKAVHTLLARVEGSGFAEPPAVATRTKTQPTPKSGVSWWKTESESRAPRDSPARASRLSSE